VKKTGEYDVVIVGGGPGGLAALHWCAGLGMTAILLEKEAGFGGQLLNIYNPITNYPGVAAANGSEMLDILLEPLESSGRRPGAEVVSADLKERRVVLADETAYSGRAIILATGVRRRSLGVPGEVEFSGRGVLRSGAKERDEVAGKRVVIVGGGDAALENALMLAERARSVTVVHRRQRFSARPEFLDAARGNHLIEFQTDATLTLIDGRDAVEAVQIENTVTGELSRVPADAVLIRIGVEPNTELFRGQVDLDEKGYIVVDHNSATSAEGVFAIGDAANPTAPTIAAAMGQASIAAKAALRLLNAGL
jgi:thioredoxin reductase (NADPH)